MTEAEYCQHWLSASASDERMMSINSQGTSNRRVLELVQFSTEYQARLRENLLFIDDEEDATTFS